MNNVLENVLNQTEAQPQIHIRFDGRSIDVNQSDLDIGPQSNDDAIRRATANHLGVPHAKLQAFAIDRAGSELTLRPEAVFGVSKFGSEIG